MVKVILSKDDKVLGETGDIVEVSDGYARNYLVPKSLAVVATEGNIKHYESIKRAQAKKIAKLVEAENGVKTKIEGASLSITVKAGENKKLFGSVTNEMIANILHTELEVDVHRKRITILAPIKQVGKHAINIKLKYGVVAEATIEVLPEYVVAEEKKEEVVVEEVREAEVATEEVVEEEKEEAVEA